MSGAGQTGLFSRSFGKELTFMVFWLLVFVRAGSPVSCWPSARDCSQLLGANLQSLHVVLSSSSQQYCIDFSGALNISDFISYVQLEKTLRMPVYYKGCNSGTAREKRCAEQGGQGRGVFMISEQAIHPESPCVHQPGGPWGFL